MALAHITTEKNVFVCATLFSDDPPSPKHLRCHPQVTNEETEQGKDLPEDRQMQVAEPELLPPFSCLYPQVAYVPFRWLVFVGQMNE